MGHPRSQTHTRTASDTGDRYRSGSSSDLEVSQVSSGELASQLLNNYNRQRGKELAAMAKYSKAQKALSMLEEIAAFWKDGELDDEGEAYVMENDTLQSLISQARSILGVPDRPTGDPE
jgi:hypothetical protein